MVEVYSPPIGEEWMYRLHKLAFLCKENPHIYDGIERVIVDIEEARKQV